MKKRLKQFFAVGLAICLTVSSFNFGISTSQVYADSVDQTSGGTSFDNNAQNPGAEDESKAFDNNTSTKWLVFANKGVIGYDFKGSDAYIITSYSITSANDEPKRDPKTWSFEGSNDGINWEVLDQQTNVEFNSRFQMKSFTIKNEKSYQMYRLNISANTGDSITQVSELQMFGTLYEQKPTAVQTPVDAESLKLIDGQAIVKMFAGGSAFDGGVTNPPGRDESKGFDRETYYKWEVDAASGVLGYDFAGESAYIVKGYNVLTAREDSEKDPKSWKLQGSNDGKEWTTLDERKNIIFYWPITSKSYVVANETAYKMYRLNITENNGGSKTAVGDLELIGAMPSDLTDGQNGGRYTDWRSSNPEGEDESKAFDNVPATKWFINERKGGLGYQYDRGTATLSAYAITSANDNAGRDPKSWSLLGSNDDFNWFTIDAQTNVSFNERNQTKNFTVKTPKAYKYYKLFIESNNGDKATQIGEVQFFGKLEADTNKEQTAVTEQSAALEAQKTVPMVNDLILTTTLGSKLSFSTLIHDYKISLLDSEKEATLKILASENSGKLFVNEVQSPLGQPVKLNAQDLSKKIDIKLVSKDGKQTETYSLQFVKMNSEASETGVKEIKANIYKTDFYTHSADSSRPRTAIDYLLGGVGRIRDKAIFDTLSSQTPAEKRTISLSEEKAVLNLGYDQSRLSFTISPSNPNATVTIDGFPVTADQESFKYTIGQGGMRGLKNNTYRKTLNPDTRDIQITITSADQTKSKTYTISVKRASVPDAQYKAPDQFTSYSTVDINNTDLAGLKIETDQGLKTAVTNSVMVLDKATKQIKLNAIAADSTADVLINGNSGVSVLDFTGDQLVVTVLVRSIYKTDQKDDYAATEYKPGANGGKYNNYPSEATYKFTFVRGK